MSRSPHLFGAVYGIIVNKKREILMLKRQNTGYYDDGYCFPAGHIEHKEISHEAIFREVKEEVGINIKKNDIKVIAVLHRFLDRDYFDVCYLINNREGEIKNNEPEKCSGLYRFGEENIPKNMAPEMKIFLEHYFKQGEEIGYYIYKE